MHIVKDIQIDIKSSDKDKILINARFIKHSILFFIHKTLDEKYDFGLINAGQGCEIQGVNKELCNGIIIYREVTIVQIQKFINEYIKWYNIVTNIYLTNKQLNNTKYYVFFYEILKQNFTEYKEIIKKDFQEPTHPEHLVTIDDLKKRPLLDKILSRIFFLFKYWF
jgi:hypothetical protein